MSEWSVAEPRKLTFDQPVDTVHVRIIGGAVNVVGTDAAEHAGDAGDGRTAEDGGTVGDSGTLGDSGSAGYSGTDAGSRAGGVAAGGPVELQVSEIEGAPLLVRRNGSTLTVAYEDVPWKGLLKWLEPGDRRRRAVVSLVVPTGTRVEVGVIGAAATVSGIAGSTVIRGVTGDATLTRITGEIEAETVSGNIEVQSAGGPLRFASVSGSLTLVDGAGPTVRADSVSGDMILDLDPGDAPTDIKLTSVSGEIAIRLPHPADAVVEADTTSGVVSNAFEDLRVSGQWGSKRITGRLGPGNGRLRATTVSGSLALLRRPARGADPAAPDAEPPQDTYTKKVL